MEDKTTATETTKNEVYSPREVKYAPSVSAYNPDDYIEEEFMYDDIWYYSDKCFSCKHWLGNDCGASTEACSYEHY